MKTLCAFLFFLLAAQANASLSYEIKIDGQGYDLRMEMSFKKDVELSYVRGALKNGDVLSKLSPNVVSVTNTPEADNRYRSLMVAKSFGIYSRLLSRCMDQNTATTWSRSCSLQTRELDGGKYMEWKGDEVTCEQKEQVICHFSIKGKALPVKILGVQIVSAELFSVKAKLSALGNFFKLYTFIQDHNLSLKRALNEFNRSVLKTELDQFEKEGTAAVKKDGRFVHQFAFKDSE